MCVCPALEPKVHEYFIAIIQKSLVNDPNMMESFIGPGTAYYVHANV